MMNAFNRVVMVVLLLVAMVLCIVLLVAGRVVVPAVAQQWASLAESVEGRMWYELELPGCVVAGVVNLILGLFVLLEVRRPRKSIRVEKAAGGEVSVSVVSITERLKYEVGQVSDVLRTRPRVLGKRSGVVVELDVEAAAGVSVPEKAGQIVEAARRVVEEDMGLKLVRPPKVSLRVVSYPRERKPPVGLAEVPPARPREMVPAEPEEVSPTEPEEVLPITPKVALPAEPEEVPPVELEERPLIEPIELVEEEDELPDLPEDFGENL
jgi:hypothetical protein